MAQEQQLVQHRLRQSWVPSNTFRSLAPSLQRHRELHDTNGDGWCNLWMDLMRVSASPADPNSDLDGDGFSAYEEMLLWQDPHRADQIPRPLSAIEVEIARQEKEAAHQLHLERLRFQHREMIAEAEAAMRRAAERKHLFDPKREQRKGDLARLSRLLGEQSRRELAVARAFLGNSSKPSWRTLSGIDSRGRPTFKRTYNEDAAISIQADALWSGGSSPLPDLDGSGIPAVGIWDEGAVLPTHENLAGRVILGEGTTFAEAAAEFQSELGLDPGDPFYQNHPTGVAGTLAASGLNRSRYRGIASGVTIKSYHLVDDYSEMAEAAWGGMLFSNHSYGKYAGWIDEFQWAGPADFESEDPEFGAYTKDTKTMDAIAYLAPHYLTVWGAGNEAVHGVSRVPGGGYAIDGDGDGSFEQELYPENPGYLTFPPNAGIPLPGATALPAEGFGPAGPGFDTIVSTGCAKNAISVGNVRDHLETVNQEEVALPYTSPNHLALMDSSSRGPTDDGRIKPDLVANGQNIDTLDASKDTGTTQQRNGTSYSAPGVTGTLALLQQLHQQLGGSSPLLSSTWKALLCNTATDGIQLPAYLGTAAQTTTLEGPDYFFGWGACNALKAAEVLLQNARSGSGSVHLCEHLLVDGSTIEIPILHDGVSDEIKVMICWIDPPYQTQLTGGLADEVNDPESHLADPDRVANRQRLMNDLDLRVISPDGQTTYQPWVIDPADDPANPLKKAAKGDNFRDNIEQVIVPAPVAGEYLVRISHKGTLKALELLTPPDPDTVLPEGAQFQLATGQSQSVSICITGNADPFPTIPALSAPTIIGSSIYFDLKGHLGVHYRIEKSTDLISWNVVASLPVEVTSFPQAIGPFSQEPGDPKTFYRAKAIPASE